MAHVSFSPPFAALNFTPLGKFYDRTSKDGSIPQILFLLGSQYNIPIGGETSVSSTGNITNDTAAPVSGKLEIAGESVDGTEVTKDVAFTAFMYFYPGIRIVGDSEIQDADVGAGPVPLQRMRYEYEDLATTDKIRVDLQGGDGNAQFVVREVVDGVETNLFTPIELTTGVINVKWEIDFLDNGLTQIFYKEQPSGTRTRVFNGTLNADIGEAKVTAKLMLDQQTTKTVKSDFMWIYYRNIFVGYDVVLNDRLKGRIKIWDTNGTEVEADWIEVFSSDHPFVGDRVIENGIIRIRFRSTPAMEVYGWNDTSQAWETTGSLIPKSSQDDLATTLQDVIIERLNDVFVKLVVKYGINDHVVRLRRGQPSVRIHSNSTRFRVQSDKRRFALSSSVIADFNQTNSDDSLRGNPLNLSPTSNPFTFTNDTDATTGLANVDDNWFAYYDENVSNDMLGFIGTVKNPIGLIITADSATDIGNIDFQFDVDPVFCMGVLEGNPQTKIGGIPQPFNINSDVDTYVKWRANEGLFSFDQRQFIRKKR